MRYGPIIVSLVLLSFSEMMTIETANAQEQRKVTIVSYTHGACVVDGKRLRPQFAVDGNVSKLGGSGYWNCEDKINSGILGCKIAVRHVYSWHDEEYPECLKIFESWVPKCIAHYENQRSKCDALKAQTGGSESPNCKFAKQTFDGYQSACNGGDSNACGILSQAAAIVEQTCQ